MPVNFELSIEGSVWEEPDFLSSLIVECHRLRKIPICELTIENLRVLIGQNIGLPFIMPLALKILAERPFCGGDYYEGDLL